MKPSKKTTPPKQPKDKELTVEEIIQIIYKSGKAEAVYKFFYAAVTPWEIIGSSIVRRRLIDPAQIIRSLPVSTPQPEIEKLDDYLRVRGWILLGD